MNAIIENLLTRRSTRAFLQKEIPDNELNEILQAAIYAPSGMGKQTWKFTVLCNQEKIQQLAELIGRKLGRKGYDMYRPQVLIIPSNQKENPHGMEDNACALENIFLAAHSFGIGSVWINQLRTLCDDPEVRALLDEFEIPSENRYVGDYHHFEEVYAVKKAQLEAAYRRQQQEISELKDFVARNKARVSTRNMAMSRQKKLDKMDVIELAAERPKPEFKFRYGRTPGRYIFETKDLVIGYDEPLSKPLSLSMERGQKIALVGANGIGKTTLLKSILGLIPAISGTCELGENLQIGYFEQEVKGDNRTTCIEEIWQEFPSFTQYEVRSALAKCGLTTKHIESQVRVLSGGEQAKVRLCKLVNRDTNILLLDEPTNHLDVDAKDSLKKALLDYRGSVLLICHEPEFYQDVVHAVWDCSKWTTKQI